MRHGLANAGFVPVLLVLSIASVFGGKNSKETFKSCAFGTKGGSGAWRILGSLMLRPSVPSCVLRKCFYRGFLRRRPLPPVARRNASPTRSSARGRSRTIK